MSISQYSHEEKKDVSYVFPISDGSSTRKRVQVHKYKGKILIDIRELYNKDDEWLPSKKGISLKVEDFKKFNEMIPLIQEAIKSMGGKLDESEDEDDDEEKK